MHLKALASEMESQAASWHLMWCLFCNDAPAGGLGGPYVKGTGNRKTFRQMVADQVSADPGLRRCANVIGWLESLADDVLSRQPPPRFTDGEGVWMETRIRSAHDPSLATDLDPDGPSRQQAALHADNARSEERLLARLWQLLRAGRVKEARALCVQCGQPWRAASLGGAGSYGPVPVGIAAGALDEELSPEEQAEDLAVETDSGSGNLRALWKWACMKAAEAAAAQALPAGRYEAAVYAALCGHLQHMLPVCGSSWEDACWAYCRAWLDVAVDEALGLDATPQAQLLAEELVVAAAQLHGDAAAAAGPSGGGDWGSLKQRQALASSLRSCVGEGMGVVQGAWPPRSLQQLANGTQIPRSFAQLFDALASSSSRELAAACREDARQLQQCLIVDDMPRLAGLIRRWLATATTGGNSTSRGAGAGDGDGAMQIEEEEDDDMGGGAAAAAATTAAAGQELGTAPAAGSSDAARTLAFGTHVLLCLASLGSLYRSSGDDAASGGGLHEAQDVAVISGAVQTALASYVSHLIGQQLVEDVPKYVAFLEGDLRTRLFGRFLAAVSAARSDADGLRAYIAASRWFDHCYSRQLQQQQQAPPGGAGNQLTTAVEAEEMRQQVAQYAADCRFSPQLSPSARVRAARWLVYPYLAARAEAPGAVDAVPPLACLDALEHVNALLAELALGDEVTAAAALELLEQVVPPGEQDGGACHGRMLTFSVFFVLLLTTAGPQGVAEC